MRACTSLKMHSLLFEFMNGGVPSVHSGQIGLIIEPFAIQPVRMRISFSTTIIQNLSPKSIYIKNRITFLNRFHKNNISDKKGI